MDGSDDFRHNKHVWLSENVSIIFFGTGRKTGGSKYTYGMLWKTVTYNSTCKILVTL